MDSMTGTDTPEAQIRRYAEDILIGRAAWNTYRSRHREKSDEHSEKKLKRIGNRDRLTVSSAA